MKAKYAADTTLCKQYISQPFLSCIYLFCAHELFRGLLTRLIGKVSPSLCSISQNIARTYFTNLHYIKLKP